MIVTPTSYTRRTKEMGTSGKQYFLMCAKLISSAGMLTTRPAPWVAQPFTTDVRLSVPPIPACELVMLRFLRALPLGALVMPGDMLAFFQATLPTDAPLATSLPSCGIQSVASSSSEVSELVSV